MTYRLLVQCCIETFNLLFTFNDTLNVEIIVICKDPIKYNDLLILTTSKMLFPTNGLDFWND